MMKFEEALNDLYHDLDGKKLGKDATEIVVEVDHSFSVSTPVVGENFTFQWQYKSPTGTAWGNSTLPGNKTSVLTVLASSGRNGYRYRCVVSYNGGTYTTAPVQLRVMQEGVSYGSGNMTVLPFVQADLSPYRTSAEQDVIDAEKATKSEVEAAAEQARVDVGAETAARTIADAALKRSLGMLWRLNEGISYVFETDSAEAYSKNVPSGAVIGDVQMIGGKSVVFNQLNKNPIYRNSLTDVTDNHDGTISINFRSASSRIAVSMGDNLNVVYFDGLVLNHRYLFYTDASVGGTASLNPQAYKSTQISAVSVSGDDSFKRCSCVCVCINLESAFCFYLSGDLTYPFTFSAKPAQLFDLTATFGSAADTIITYEQAKAAYAAIGVDIEQYHPYTPPTIISADVESVEIGGKSIPIHAAIRALPGYGWSAGNVYNEVDFERKVYVQRVQRVDIGTLGLSRTTAYTNPLFTMSRPSNMKPMSSNDAVCSMYSFSTTNLNNIADMCFAIGESSFSVRNDKYTDTTSFKSAMSGVFLYFSLADPIETDISSLLDDSFESIEVEPGGTITFRQADADKHLPVPNREEYIVSTRDAGGGV